MIRCELTPPTINSYSTPKENRIHWLQLLLTQRHLNLLKVNCLNKLQTFTQEVESVKLWAKQYFKGLSPDAEQIKDELR